METFKQFVSEGVVIDNEGNVTWSDAFGSEPSWVSSHDRQYRNKGDGKYRSHGTIIGGEHEYFYAYAFDSKNPETSLPSDKLKTYLSLSKPDQAEFIKTEKEKFLRAFKHPSDSSSDRIIQLIDKSLKRFDEHLDSSGLSKGEIDFIIPLPSSAKLNKILALELSTHCPNGVILPILEKTTNGEVNAGVPSHVPGFEKANKLLQSVLKQIKTPVRKDELFKLTGLGGIPSAVRAYFRNFFKIAEKQLEDAKKIEGRNILLVDDTLYMGHSVRDAIRELSKYNPASISVYIFLQEQRGGMRN